MGESKKIRNSGYSLIFIIVVISIITYRSPLLASLFVYDRQAILSGELWRLCTAPLVHFSFSHIFWDIVIFSAAGLAIEVAGFQCFWLVCVFATIIPGFLFLLACPEIELYGGLSGLATGAAVYFALCSLKQPKKNSMLWLGILAFISIKIFIETVTGTSLFAQAGDAPFRVLPTVHIWGYFGALITLKLVSPEIIQRTASDSRQS